ncbi:MAG: AsmA family protein, partial [Methanobrevibacter sp.]|nr:AsmA family protein [Methanobrevibacter sp.]
MKKIILIFFLLFVVGIGSFVAWFAYSFNGENYKKELIEDLTNATGRAVQIEGPVTLSWVPLPTVVISDLSISNQEGSPDPVMFSVKQIYAEIDWKSLFKKPLVIKKVILRSPSLLLERVRSYQTNFDFPFLFKGEEKGDLKKRKSFSLTINELEVEDGGFTYSNAISKEKLRIKGIDGSGKISSLNGPFSFSGSFLVNESKESIDFTIDKIEAFQPVKIDLSLNDKDSKTSIRGKGSVFYDPNKPDEWMTLEGIISSKNISFFLEKVGIQNWPKEQVVGSFTFKITPNKTVLESLTIRQGQGEEETSFFMGMQSPKNDGKKIPTLAIKNIDLEKWFPLIEKISTETYFNHWKTDFYVQIEEAKFHSELSKQIFAEGKFENGVFDFSNFVVQLPYQTSFSGKGFFELQKRKIDADIQFQSEEFRPFIEWLLQKKVSVLSKNQLKKAQLRGHLIAQSNDINFKVKETTVDEVQLSGNLGLKNSSFNAFF